MSDFALQGDGRLINETGVYGYTQFRRHGRVSLGLERDLLLKEDRIRDIGNRVLPDLPKPLRSLLAMRDKDQEENRPEVISPDRPSMLEVSREKFVQAPERGWGTQFPKGSCTPGRSSQQREVVGCRT